MFALDLTLVNTSPFVLSAGRMYHEYVHSVVRNYIPSRTLRGAFLTMLVREFGLSPDEVDRLVRENVFVVYPGIYVGRLGEHFDSLEQVRENIIYGRDALITHSLCIISKWERTEPRSLGIDKLLSNARKLMEGGADPVEAVAKALAERFVEVSRRGAEGDPRYAGNEYSLRSGATVVRVGGCRWEVRSARIDFRIKTCIDWVRRGALGGRLHGYEFIVPYSVYKAFLVVDDDVHGRLRDFFDALTASGEDGRGVYVSVGRFANKGFGRFLVCAREERLENSLLHYVSGSGGDLVALELITEFIVPAPLPKPLEDPLATGSREVLRVGARRASKVSEARGDVELEVLAVFGGVSEVRGFSVRTGREKLTVAASSPGTLVIARVSGDFGECVRALVAGVDPYSTAGFNLVIPLVRDPFMHVTA